MLWSKLCNSHKFVTVFKAYFVVVGISFPNVLKRPKKGSHKIQHRCNTQIYLITQACLSTNAVLNVSNIQSSSGLGAASARNVCPHLSSSLSPLGRSQFSILISSACQSSLLLFFTLFDCFMFVFKCYAINVFFYCC